MARITINDELENELTLIKNKNWNLRYDRGLESTVAFLVTDHNQRVGISAQIERLKNDLDRSIPERISQGVSASMKRMIKNILSLGEP